MSHVHVYPTLPKVSQYFENEEFLRGPDHELISNYQVRPLARRGSFDVGLYLRGPSPSEYSIFDITLLVFE